MGGFLGIKKQSKENKLPELIIMPAFNEMVGGTALNKDFTFSKSKSKKKLKLKNNKNKPTPFAVPQRQLMPLGPLLKAMNERKAKIYMLDGTYLGELGKL